jgi:dTDP-4-amino-4,6-dideoxygalactose transaminase
MSTSNAVKVPYSYLPEQFADPDPIFAEIKRIVGTGDYTLGHAVEDFEQSFASAVQTRYAIGVNSGTDALRLSLKALGIGPGDEVITAANTFIATVGAIADVGAKPIFIDCNDEFVFDLDKVEGVITARTKAVIPVHLTGSMVDMPRLLSISNGCGIYVVEDACQAFKSSLGGRSAGSWGICGTFSLHPLKFVNIWGDGGVITTNNDDLARRLRLLRNHGLASRDVVVMLGCNSRLDSIQAAVANQVLSQADWIIKRRNENASFYDREFSGIAQIKVPRRDSRIVHSFVTYQVLAEARDALLDHCAMRGIECKVHYPIPVYCQEGLHEFGYRCGDFPVADRHARTTITLPVHQYLSPGQLSLVVETIREFYGA